VAVNLFHITREAVHNAVKHAKANLIQVMLEAADGRVLLSVRDDGIGIQTGEQKPMGFGQRILRHRAAVIGGELKIESAPGKGTVVTCRAPASGGS
jgi:NarL family two-component system sensor histidine kinase LiaS